MHLFCLNCCYSLCYLAMQHWHDDSFVARVNMKQTGYGTRSEYFRSRPILHLSLFFYYSFIVQSIRSVSSFVSDVLSCFFAITVACYQLFIVKMCGLFFLSPLFISLCSFQHFVAFACTVSQFHCFVFCISLCFLVSCHCTACVYSTKHQSSLSNV